MKRLNIDRKLSSIRKFCCKRIVPAFLAASMLVSSAPDLSAFAEAAGEAAVTQAVVQAEEDCAASIEDGDTGDTESADDMTLSGSDEADGAQAVGQISPDDDADTAETESAENIAVSKFDIEISDGYNRTDHTDDGSPVYVWESEDASERHSFTFNIHFETIGNGTIPTGTVNITVPFSDAKSGLELLEMSVPYCDGAADDDHQWAYKLDKGSAVIYNIKDVDAGSAYDFGAVYAASPNNDYEGQMYAELVMYDSAPSDENMSPSVLDRRASGTLYVAVDITSKNTSEEENDGLPSDDGIEAPEQTEEDSADSIENTDTKGTASEDDMASSGVDEADDPEQTEESAAAILSSDAGDAGPKDDITVSKFHIEILDGYNRKEDDTYVWEAKNPMAGHSFVFNILLETSGKGTIPKGSVNITIPASVLENGFDLLEMSVPYYTDITEGLGVDHKWAYKFDDEGNAVIYNIKDVDAGNAYIFNVAYTTTQRTYYYEDMAPSEGVYAKLVMYDKDPSEEDAKERYAQKTDDLYVAIDTTAKLTQTTKKSPSQMYTSWNELWGDQVKPANDGDYYYLVWEVESVVDTNSTQFYDFSLSDLDESFNVKSFTSSDPSKNYDPAALKVLGYNYSGNGNAYLPDPAKVEDQDIFGKRRDYVLTAVPREWYDELEDDERIVLENTADAALHPADNDDLYTDEDTKASSSQTYTLQKPKFTAPNGSYRITKKGDRRNYRLDRFAYADDDIPDYVYDITVTGYSYADTFEYIGDGTDKGEKYVPEEDHDNYGKKPLHYEMTDDEVSVSGLAGENRDDTYTITEDDYCFTYIDLTYDINMVSKDDPFDDASKTYNLTKPDPDSGYDVSFDIYGKLEGSGEYTKIAAVVAYRYSDAAASITYADGMSGKAVITYSSDRNIKITFADDVSCTGYKIVTSDECYYSAVFNIRTGIQLKRTEGLLKWINASADEEAEDRITELQLTNKASMAVSYEDGTAVPASKQSDSGTDYQNESKRQSAITKSVTAVNNNPLYKRYEISWRIDISEIVLGEGNTPVTQNGGTFYDLLPQGSSVDLSTVQVYKENGILVESTAKTMPGTGNRVLLRVVVEEDQPGDKYSLVFTSYHTWEDISAFGTNVLNPAAYVSGNDDMADLSDGSRGNDRDGSIELITQSILSAGDFSEAELSDRAVFNYATYVIKALVASNVGASKSVKNAKEGSYSAETIVDKTTREYSYRLRIENGTTTRSIDNIFVDFLESYTSNGIESQWKGTLRSIDVTNLTAKHIIPVVYYSTTPFVVENTEVYYENGDQRIYLVEGSSEITPYEEGKGKEGFFYQGIRSFLPETVYNDDNTAAGGSNGSWKVLDPMYYANGSYTLPDGFNEKITAVAIDFTYADKSRFSGQIESDVPGADNGNARVKADGRYIMGLNEAAYVILTMDSSDVGLRTKSDFIADYMTEHDGAEEAEAEAAYSEYVNGYNAYNDIFMATRYYDRMQNDSANAVDAFIEQSYTTVRYRIRSDFYMLKVNSENTEQTLGGITFNLKGISDYGTAVDITLTTTSNGKLEFEDLEIGTYTLTETDSGRDWLRDNTEYTVSVNSDGKVTVSPELYAEHYSPDYDETDHSRDDNPFILENVPRIHADISFDKKIFNGKNKPFGNAVPGARFMLSGTSDYSNPITKFAVSDLNGRVVFEDVEKGTYELKEIEAPDGYALSNVVYRVVVDRNGNWSIADTSYDPDDPEDYSLLYGDSSNGYIVGNEKYREFCLQKRSTQAVGKDNKVYLLEGAVFNLYGMTNDGEIVNIDAVSEFSAEYGDGIARFGNLEPGTYYLREITPPVYTYINNAGEEVVQNFYPDETVYTVKVDADGVTITAPNGDPLKNAKSDGKTLEEVYDFPNIPVGGLVVVRKVWVDNLTSDERAAKVQSPDIVISRDAPDPFENEYALFDYSYSGKKLGNLGISIENNKTKLKIFRRYTDKVTFSDETISANNKTYPKLLVKGKDVGAVIVSTGDSPKPIYGWLDAATSTYYWYADAFGAKLPTARDLFTGTSITDADFRGINFADVSSFEYMFNACENLVTVTKLTRPANAKPASAEKMFLNCKSLAKDGTLDLSEFDTTGITDMSDMFHNAFQNGSGSKLDWGTALHTESVISFSYAFNACSALTVISAPEIVTDSVITKTQTNSTTGEVTVISRGFEYMFGDSKKLVSIPPLKRSSTVSSSVSMHHMFHQCFALEKIDLSGFHTAGVHDMQYLFNYCQSLTALDLSSFDTSSVTTMQNMFAQCNVITEIKGMNFDTSKVENMVCMFDTCKALRELDISSFTMESLTNANTMFCNCQAIVTIYTNNSFDLSVLTANNGNMFQNDNKLVGGRGSTYGSAYGSRAHIDGGKDNPGYFTDIEDKPPAAGIDPFRSSAPRAFGADRGNTVMAYATEGETTRAADGPDYRNSANHNNANGSSGVCRQQHFYVVKTRSDVEALKVTHPNIYELVKDLKDNEWIYVFDDIVGEGFHVWEENVPEGYESDYDNHTDEDGNHKITSVENGLATVTNTMKALSFGSLTLSKTVIDHNTKKDVTDDVNTKFVFEITLSNTAVAAPQTLTALYYKTKDGEAVGEKTPVLFVDGKATVNIQSGYSLKFADLPEGMEYTVQEVKVNEEEVKETAITADDAAAVTNRAERKISGVIAEDADLNVKYENAIEADLREKGSFRLKKCVVNENGDVDPEHEYVFTVTFENLTQNTEYYIYKTVTVGGKENEVIVQTFKSNSDRSATVVVRAKHGDALTFKDIPYDAAYYIIEEDSEAYISSYEITAANGDVKESAANANADMSLSTSTRTMGAQTDGDTVTFTNNIVKTQQVTLTKTVGGESEYTNGEEKIYTFYAEFTNLGAGYTLDAGDRGMFTANAQGTASFRFLLKAGETITFTNVPVGAGYVIYEECEGGLIPYYEVYYTDETSGVSQKASPAPASPSTETADEIARDVAASEPEKADKARGNSYLSGTVELHKNTEIRFYNNNPVDLTIDKTVGSFVDKSKGFGFKVIFSYNGEPFAGSYTAMTEGGARITDSDYRADVINEFDAEGAVYFVLKHGSRITFKGLPYGTTYRIIEEEYDDHKASYTVDLGSGAGQKTESNIAEGTLTQQQGVTVHFTNDWDGDVYEMPVAGADITRRTICTLGFFIMTAGLIGEALCGRRRRRCKHT